MSLRSIRQRLIGSADALKEFIPLEKLLNMTRASSASCSRLCCFSHSERHRLCFGGSTKLSLYRLYSFMMPLRVARLKDIFRMIGVSRVLEYSCVRSELPCASVSPIVGCAVRIKHGSAVFSYYRLCFSGILDFLPNAESSIRPWLCFCLCR